MISQDSIGSVVKDAGVRYRVLIHVLFTVEAGVSVTTGGAQERSAESEMTDIINEQLHSTPGEYSSKNLSAL